MAIISQETIQKILDETDIVELIQGYFPLKRAGTIEDTTLRAEVLARVGARFIPQHEGGTKPFDLRTWMLENPEIAEELRAAAGAW